MSTPVGRAATRHRSVLALLDAHPGESDPWELIRRLAREKVAYAKKNGWSGPSFCPKELASIFGIFCKEVTHDIGADGRILSHPGAKIVIEYRKDRPLERQRFTIFHEFAHTLFPDYCTFVAQHRVARESIAEQEQEFEALCDVAAAEMLMPLEDFDQDRKALAPGKIASVQTLRQRYETSIEAAIRRLMDLEDRIPVAAIFLTDQKKEGYVGDGPLWVKSFNRNGHFKAFVKTGVMPPQNSVALKCYESGRDENEGLDEQWSVGRDLSKWKVEAGRLPDVPEAPKYPKVVALLIGDRQGTASGMSS